ncbi:MAG: hypothetical protein B6D37_00775 [Sphingobacteriales bacterium UTBCD1]|jgi:uncharacterized protein YqhQ|nr:MAG: hypothetical protein B6D37_00775 [Sphingobacteriales bacterium UTBCD1]
MKNITKSKVFSLLVFGLGIILTYNFIQKLFERHWIYLIVLIPLIVGIIYSALTLLDVEIRITISRKLYYTLLILITIGLLILFIKLL